MNEQRIGIHLRRLMSKMGRDELLFLRDTVVPLLLAAAIAPKLLPPVRAPKLLPAPAQDPVPEEERELVNAVRACKGLRPLYGAPPKPDRGQQWVSRCEATGAGFIDLYKHVAHQSARENRYEACRG